jgi:rubrerythrin
MYAGTSCPFCVKSSKPASRQSLDDIGWSSDPTYDFEGARAETKATLDEIKKAPKTIHYNVHGDIVQGDKVSTSVDNSLIDNRVDNSAHDSVIQQKTLAPQAPAPKHFKHCPYCGEEINLPKPPRFCPYCNEQIQT